MSEPVSLRVGQTTYWYFSEYGIQSPIFFLKNYWLLKSFWKFFETTRDRITVFTDISFGKYYIFIYILLIIMSNNILKKRQKVLKKRVIFMLFKNIVRKRKHWPDRIWFNHYNKVIRFVLDTNKRFLSYCNLTCQKFGKNILAKFFNKKLLPLNKKMQVLDIPLQIKVNNIFSVIDRSYVYIWRSFYFLICKHMWYAKNMRYFVSTIKLCFTFLLIPNAQLLADHIAYLLKKSRKHWQIIKTMKQLLSLLEWFSPNFKNIKIKVKGCIQDSERTRSATIGRDFVTTQTFTTPLEYALAHAATPFGSLGIKVWIVR